MKVIQVCDFEGGVICEFVDVPRLFEWYNKWKFSGRYCNGKVNFRTVCVDSDHQCKIYEPVLPNRGRPFECFSSTNLTMFVPDAGIGKPSPRQ